MHRCLIFLLCISWSRILHGPIIDNPTGAGLQLCCFEKMNEFGSSNGLVNIMQARSDRLVTGQILISCQILGVNLLESYSV
jgi:hypothetical protein